MSNDVWVQAQVHEAKYWGGCYNAATFNEIQKQYVYAREMGLESFADAHGDFDLQNKSILDVGGGPWSMLLRSYNYRRAVVADPLPCPPSVLRRYKNYGINFQALPGEELDTDDHFDEVWIYNVLQHVMDPAEIIRRVQKLATRVRIFEWVYIPTDTCHPHLLTPEGLLNWFSGSRIEHIGIKQLNEQQCVGQAFIGIFSNV